MGAEKEQAPILGWPGRTSALGTACVALVCSSATRLPLASL